MEGLTTRETQFNRRRADAISRAQTKYSDEDILDALRTCARELGIEPRAPSFKAYTAWRLALAPAARRDVPSPARVGFGGWSANARAAGLEPNLGTLPGHSQVYTRDSCVAALHECREAVGHIPTAQEYEDFSWDHNGRGSRTRGKAKPPSLAQIRNRLARRWLDCLAIAFPGEAGP